jgi:hypothetical protein
MPADIAALVANDHLDLDAVFDGADWRYMQHIADFRMTDGGEAHTIDVVLQVASCYGIEAFRWADDQGETGPVCLSRAEAVRGGRQEAKSCEGMAV